MEWSLAADLSPFQSREEHIHRGMDPTGLDTLLGSTIRRVLRRIGKCCKWVAPVRRLVIPPIERGSVFAFFVEIHCRLSARREDDIRTVEGALCEPSTRLRGPESGCVPGLAPHR